MATPAHQLPRFQLRARIRAQKAAAEEITAGSALAERIAALPGVEAVECGEDTMTHPIAAYIYENEARRTIGNSPALLLCRVGADGISLRGLDNWAKHQVIMRGWGRLLGDRVLLFLPRDHNELETCWSIIRQAYDNISDPSAAIPGAGNASAWEMPKYSRTTLQ